MGRRKRMMKKVIKGRSFVLRTREDTPKEAKEKDTAYKSLKIGDFVRIKGTKWDGAEGIVSHIEVGNSICVTTYTVDPEFSFMILDPRCCQKIAKTTIKGRNAAKKMALGWRRAFKK